MLINGVTVTVWDSQNFFLAVEDDYVLIADSSFDYVPMPDRGGFWFKWGNKVRLV